MERRSQPTREPLHDAAQTFGLTERETEVLRLILCGYQGKEIAESLGISTQTVREYFKHLATKIGGRNRAEMIARVLDRRAR
jgi:DNA-binding NarL/FixJ family response regulator